MTEIEAAGVFELRIDGEVYRSVAKRCLDRVPSIWTDRRISELPRTTRTGLTAPEVRIQTADNGPIQVELVVDVDDSVPIPAVASSLQREVKTVIEEMTGAEVSRIDVSVRRLWSVSEFTPPPPSSKSRGGGEDDKET